MEDKIKIHCNKCGIETWHSLLYDKNISEEFTVDCYEMSAGTINKLYQCCGCDSICYALCEWFSECDDRYFQYYPSRIFRKMPSWLEEATNIDREVYWLFKEIYSAVYQNSRRLATMGIRTLFDIYIRMKVGDKGNFKSGIKELLSKNFITLDQKDIIEIAMNAGNASAHRSFNPDKKTLECILDIIENLFQLEYLKSSTKDMKNKIPKRTDNK